MLSLKLNEYGPPAFVGGSVWRQMESDEEVVVVYDWPLKMVFTVEPGLPKPHTTAACGARCRTMWSPSVSERLNGNATTDATAQAANRERTW